MTTSPLTTAATTTSAQTVALSGIKPIGSNSPDVEVAAVDGVTVRQAIYIGPCGNDEETTYEYRIPANVSTLTATVAVGDRTITEADVQLEFFVDKARAAVTNPRLGTPVEVVLDVVGADILSIRGYAVKAGSCGESQGVVLTKAEFSSAKNPAAKKPADGPSDYVAETTEVSDDCRSFYFHTGTEWMRLNGQTYHHSLSAGRDGDIGDDESGPCTFEFNLGRSAKRLVAVAGVHDTSKSTFTCRAELSIDGTVAQTLDLSLGMTAPVDIPVPNALRLRVVFTFLGPGYGECVLGDFRILRPAA